MGSVHLQWEREGRKQTEKEANKERALNLCLFFFLHGLFTCSFQLHLTELSPYIKQVPIILVLLVTSVSSNGGEMGAAMEGRWVQ